MQNLVSKIRKPMWSSSTNVTDRRTDDTQSQDHALHYNSASRGKNCNLMPRIASPNLSSAPRRRWDRSQACSATANRSAVRRAVSRWQTKVWRHARVAFSLAFPSRSWNEV